MHASIVIPTMYRKDRLLRCVLRTLETAGHLDIEVIVVIDCDDDSMDAITALKDARVRVLFNAERQGAIACWNQGLAAAQSDILVFFNDDVFPMPGWLDAALEAHQRELGGYGMVGFNDGYQDGNKLSVQYLFDRRFCIDVLGGVMAYPVYRFYCNDTETHARAHRAGRFYWCRDALVEHEHWTRPGFNRVERFDLDNSQHSPADERLFKEREMHGFPNNFEPVLKG